MSLDFAAILEAQRRLRPYLTPTPLEPLWGLGENVYAKLENVNILHSFKIRGALNAILGQEAIAREHGVITASAGNHGLGLVYAATRLGIKARVVMPEHAPQRKIEGVKRYGAEIILHGAIYDEAEAYARQWEQNTGALFVSAYNDPWVMAGQGTIALEIFDQLPAVQRVIVPVGGGGLISGVGLALKTLRPSIEVLGVMSTATPAMYNHVKGTAYPQDPSTLADGLSGDIEADSLTLPLVQRYADELYLVDEAAIGEAIRWMFTAQGWVIEGSSATTIATLQKGQIVADGKPTALVITGGNIDAAKFLQLMV